MKKNISLTTLLTLFFCTILSAQEIYVATNGNDNNVGTIDAPLATLIGARDKSRTTGIKTIYIRGGRYRLTTTCSLNAQDDGISFSGYKDEVVIMDGSKSIDPSEFQLVEGTLLNNLNNKAKENVYSQVITDMELKALLSLTTSQISMNDKMITVARYPNIGFAHVNVSTVTGETINSIGTSTAPKGAIFKLKENIDAVKWNAEINRLKRMRAKGYFSAPWFKEEIEIASVSTNGDMQLKDGSKYGMTNFTSSEPSRMFAYNLLCELDEPGEWFYDPTDSRVYIWPILPIDSKTTVGVWAGPQCFEINGGQNISVKKMTIQNLGKGVNGNGAINVIGTSKNILIAGITFRFISEPITAVNFLNDVRDSKVLSCDFYDIPNCGRLYGGGITPTSVVYGNNSIENCHFTQIYSKDFYGKAIGINGAGNTFKNNLIHNMNGQPLTHAGIDHLLELNEVFNVGIEEGDGGAFYTGNDLVSYGNIIRHNFVHHIMSVPSLIGRASFFSDDLDGGETVEENVLYKGGWETIKMNMGGGHTVNKNVLLDCYTGIRAANGGTSHYNSSMVYVNSSAAGKTPTTNVKDNYVGRMLGKVGVSGWLTGLNETNWNTRIEQFWKDRYPVFASTMDSYASSNTMNAFGSQFTGNMFWSSDNTNINTGGSNAVVSGSQNLADLTLFENSNTMNFKFKEPRPVYAPNIPFQNIGLYKDEYRCAVPDKDTYRQNVKTRFEGQACHSSIAYNIATINARLYYNSGDMIFKLTPCLIDDKVLSKEDFSEIQEETLKMFPNPTEGLFEIFLPDHSQKGTIDISNVLGQVISSKKYEEKQGRINLDITNQSSGVYFVTVKLNGKKIGCKIVKK